MSGLRIHLTGSAAGDCDHDLLALAHSFVTRLSERLIASGEGLLVGAGGDPLGKAGLPCIFDWTALEVIASALDPSPGWPATRQGRFCAVASQSGIERVPEERQDTWTSCKKRSDFKLDLTPPGWRMAGLIRDHQLLHGDILLILGGGAGAELLARQYREDGKPVIPIHAEIGAFNNDGNGGSRYLHEKALTEVDTFFRLRDGAGDAVSRLSGLRLTANCDPEALAAATAELIADLRPRPAFYVRLLDESHDDFGAVESFFREVVDPVVEAKGFSPAEIGMHPPEDAFMNVEIFRLLHYASLVIVDLTGVRPNCTMELGYALGRHRRVVISALDGTHLPFDSDKLPTFTWNAGASSGQETSRYLEWFDRHVDYPPLVEQKS
jgi:hypothetical protein